MNIFNTVITATALVTVLVASTPNSYAMDTLEETRQIQVQKTLFVDSATPLPEEIWTPILSQALDLQISAPEDKAIAQCLNRLRSVCRGFYTMVYGALRVYKAPNLRHPLGFLEQFPNLTSFVL